MLKAKTPAERAKTYRDAKKAERDAVTVNNVTKQSVTVERDAQPDECNSSLFATRTDMDILYTGPWLNADQLMASPYKHNLVPIPGDYDYQGVAVHA